MHRHVLRRAVSCSLLWWNCLAVGGVAWSQTWDGLGANVNWDTADNWNPNGVPANDGTALLVFAGTNRGSPFVNAPWNIHGLVFNATAGTFAIGGNTLTIRAGGITNDSTNNLEQINNAILLGASQTWNAAGGALTFGGAINLNGKLLTVDGSSNTSMAGSVSASTILKNGAGTLTLSGNADNVGLGLTVNSGTVVLAKLSTSSIRAIGVPGMTIHGGTVQISNAVNTGIDQIHTQAPVTINGGTFDFNGKVVEGWDSLNGNGGTITNLAASTTATMVVGETGGSGTYLGSINDGVGVLNAVMALAKSGTGTQTLGGANTYTGATNIIGGTLRLESGTALGSTSGGTSVANGATLDLGGQAIGAEPLFTTGFGGARLTNSSAAAASLAGDVVINDFDTIIDGFGDITLSGALAGHFRKFDSNRLTLSGNTDNSNLTVVAGGGTVVLGKSSSGTVHAVAGLDIYDGTAQLGGTGGDQFDDFNSEVVVNSGTFDFNGRNERFYSLYGPGGIITNSAAGASSTMSVRTGDYAGVIQDGAGTMALTKTGPSGQLTLQVANTYSGATTIDGGTIALGNGGSLSGAGNISIATAADSSGTLDVNGVGAFITQAGAASLTVGSGTGLTGAAVLNIGFQTSGTVTTGTGPLTINKTGAISIGGATTTGTLNALGNVTIDGGVLQRTFGVYGGASGSVFNLATGKTMTILNGGRATFEGPYALASAIYNISGTNSSLNAGFIQINEGAQVNVSSGGFISSADYLDIGYLSDGTLVVDGAGSSAVANGMTHWGRDATANVTFRNNATGTFSGGISMSNSLGGVTNSTALVNVLSGADLNVGNLTLIDFGAVPADSATLNIDGSGSTVTLQPATNLTIGQSSTGPAVVNVQNGGALTVGAGGTATINARGTLNLDGGSLTVGNLTNNGTFRFTAGTLTMTEDNGAFAGSLVGATTATTINISADNVSLGRDTGFFNHQGMLNVFGNTVTLHSAANARLGIRTLLEDGTINAPNGVTFASGSSLIGSGTVNARVTGELGSVIIAAAIGSVLTLGDAASPAGFNFAGELRVRDITVTLNSSGLAGLGNLTTLGLNTSPGTLNAANGFVVELDEAITGFGTIHSTNTLAKRSHVNGVVQGNSAAEPITFTGYIKGVGTFDHVTFAGTFDPGLSPNLTMVGSITFGSTNTLIMEVGGTNRGSDYDAIVASGNLGFGGTLAVTLINGFNPAVGNSFDLFDWASFSGAFNTPLQLPTLASGLSWNTSQLYTTGVLSVMAGLAGDYNFDGTVDAADYVVWRKFDGTPQGYNTWRANYGLTAGGGSTGGASGTQTVPEPASAMLLAIGLLSARWAGRRRIQGFRGR